MEQWEKDYIEAVTSAKLTNKQRNAADSSYEEGYDSSRWIEIRYSDGSKHYIPKETAFSSGKRGIGKKKKPQTGLKRRFHRIGRILVLVILLSSVLIHPGFGRNQERSVRERRHISLQGLVQGNILGETYVNGIGFANMMEFFEEMQEERHAFLNEVAQNINDLSAIDIEKWERISDDRKKKLEELKYADSYQEYVDVEEKVFRQQGEMLTLLKYGAQAYSVLELYYQLADADLLLKKAAMEAMDQNGIQYTVDASGLRYWYQNY
jgi:hypothetical protein